MEIILPQRLHLTCLALSKKTFGPDWPAMVRLALCLPRTARSPFAAGKLSGPTFNFLCSSCSLCLSGKTSIHYYIHRFRSKLRYWIASLTCSVLISALPARSAIDNSCRTPLRCPTTTFPILYIQYSFRID
jgi:hypothetical protein